MTESTSNRGRANDTARSSRSPTDDNLIADDSVFFLDDDDFQTIFQEDYYARLNLSRDVR